MLYESLNWLTAAFIAFPGNPTPWLFATQVRQTALSYDGSVLLAACEDASIHRWDLYGDLDAAEQQAEKEAQHEMASAAAGCSGGKGKGAFEICARLQAHHV